MICNANMTYVCFAVRSLCKIVIAPILNGIAAVLIAGAPKGLAPLQEYRIRLVEGSMHAQNASWQARLTNPKPLAHELYSSC